MTRILTLFLSTILGTPVLRAELPPFTGGAPITVGDPDAVRHVAPPPAWNRYLIQVWQYRTDAERDLGQYRSVGIGAFHIDRGWKQDDRVAFARDEGLPYYVDHAADKGLLHLTERTGVNDILRKHELLPRPVSLGDPAVIEELERHLDNNIGTTKDGPVLAYSFDDEISLGAFNTPAEVDFSPGVLAEFRAWLRQEYGDIARLNARWETDYVAFSEALPVSFEAIRPRHAKPPFSAWRLSRWMDWRAFMDTHFARVLGGLTRHANGLDPDTPAGFVGAQQPSAYGGYDYEKLCREIQFIEAYDIGGTNEILRSFWSWPERRPRVQTWFSRGDARLDRWFHWYYLLHGNRGAIAWPDTRGHGPWFGENGPAPFLVENADALREVQGEISADILAPGARFETDGIALYYSMSSIRASWVTDVIPHGRTWPNRSSSLDNSCQSAGKNRVAWCKLLEDCGYQYKLVSDAQVASGHLLEHGYRVLILNRALCLGDAEAKAIRDFAEAGGTVIADHWCGVLDERGDGRTRGALDDLFGRDGRVDEPYFGGGGQLCELNGERYREPYLARLEYEGALFHEGIAIPERTRTPVSIREAGEGRAVYLNLSPLAYFDNANRSGAYGETWRDIVGDLLAESVPASPVSVESEGGDSFPLVEIVRWRLGNGRLLVGAVFNPSRQGAIDGLGRIEGTSGNPVPLALRHRDGWRSAVDRRTGESFRDGPIVEIEWSPFEPVVLETDLSE